MRRIWRAWMRRRRVRRVERALALHRTEVRPDGLKLDALCTRLELRWTARDVHPWDGHLPDERRRRIFAEQAMADTEAVIGRCFEALPEVDAIELAVADRSSGGTLMSGVVERKSWESGRPLASIRMRLSELGVVQTRSVDAAR